eukprot:495966-Heterocapsa_arctica.AAC.1
MRPSALANPVAWPLLRLRPTKRYRRSGYLYGSFRKQTYDVWLCEGVVIFEEVLMFGWLWISGPSAQVSRPMSVQLGKATQRSSSAS